jgi:hypothetical protein
LLGAVIAIRDAILEIHGGNSTFVVNAPRLELKTEKQMRWSNKPYLVETHGLPELVAELPPVSNGARALLASGLPVQARDRRKPNGDHDPVLGVIQSTLVPLALGTLTRWLRTWTQGEIDEARFDEQLTILLDRMEKDLVVVDAFCLLYGPQVGTALGLSKTISVHPASPDLLNDLVAPASAHAGAFDVADAFESTSILRARQVVLGTEEVATECGRVASAVNSGLLAFRVATPRRVGAWYPTVRGATALDYIGMTSPLVKAQPVRAGRWPLEPAHYENFEKLEARVSDTSLPAQTRIALERLSSPDTIWSSQPILDYWVGLEALILPKGPELSYRAAMRLAYLLGESPDERRRVFDEARQSYEIRSTVVHGRRVEKTKQDAGTEAARQLLRRSLYTFLLSDVKESELDALILDGDRRAG